MQEQQSTSKEEWKTISFNKGKKRQGTIKIKDPPARTSINVTIFYATTGKFLSTQTLNYKVRQNMNQSGENLTGINLPNKIDNEPIRQNPTLVKNQFSSLMEQDMVLDKTKHQIYTNQDTNDPISTWGKKH